MTTVEYTMDHKDELLLIDLHAALQADIQKAWEEAGQCKQVIMTSGLRGGYKSPRNADCVLGQTVPG